MRRGHFWFLHYLISRRSPIRKRRHTGSKARYAWNVVAGQPQASIVRRLNPSDSILVAEMVRLELASTLCVIIEGPELIDRATHLSAFCFPTVALIFP